MPSDHEWKKLQAVAACEVEIAKMMAASGKSQFGLRRSRLGLNGWQICN